MEWKSGEDGRQHAQAFAEELKQLMLKYEAELCVDIHGDAWAEMQFDFNCCSAGVYVGRFTDGTDLKIVGGAF